MSGHYTHRRIGTTGHEILCPKELNRTNSLKRIYWFSWINGLLFPLRQKGPEK